jgi:hypothetical protein
MLETFVARLFQIELPSRRITAFAVLPNGELVTAECRSDHSSVAGQGIVELSAVTWFQSGGFAHQDIAELSVVQSISDI